MDAISYVYNGKSWKACPTGSDKNSFFHAAFGVRANGDEAYLDKRVKYRRRRWATFLSFFEGETIPPRLGVTLKKCFSVHKKYKDVSLEDQDNFEDYVLDIMKEEYDVTMEEIPILATLENVTVVLFKDGESEPARIIKPDSEILGSYPNTEKSKGEVVVRIEGNTFCRMDSFEDSVVTSFKYRKGGTAGIEGVQFKVGLLTVFLLNALQKLSNWKLSTENMAAGKFDDVVLESPEGATLLTAKHKQNKKITVDDLMSTNSKRDDFSIPKYFLSYEAIKKSFKLKEVIICTNANVEGKIMKFLRVQNVNTENLLHYENYNCKFYTFSEEILPYLKENVKIYYEKNWRNKGFDESLITEENMKDFLGHLQLFFNYPGGNDIGKITEQLLSQMKRLDNSYIDIFPLDIHTKMLDWFQLRDGIYLTELYAKEIFSEIRRDKHLQRLEKFNISMEKSKREVVMHSGDEIADENVVLLKSSLIRYKKEGNTGIEGVQFTVGLLTVFFLNALQKLSNWKLSTANMAAGKFDDVVLESPQGATLLTAKHKQNKQKMITLDDLMSTNLKNDFSIPKLFLSYDKIKNTFKLKKLIICTNANVDSKVMKYLEAKKVDSDSLLHYDGCDSKFYTFRDEFMPLLKENIKSYYKMNFQNKNVDESAFTEENIKDFLRHLQLVFNYPSGNEVRTVVERLLSHIKFLDNLYVDVSPLDIYAKMLEWFQQKYGVYLTELYAKAIFSEIWRDKYWQRLEQYNISFQCSDLNFQTYQRLFHFIAEGGCLLQMKIFSALQNNETKFLLVSPDDDVEKLKHVIEAFSLPQHTILVLVWPKSDQEFVIREASCKLREILDKFRYKKVVLVADCNNIVPQLIGLSYDVRLESVTLEDLSTDSQQRLLEKRNIIFQGNLICLKELFARQATEDYAKLLNIEELEKLVRNEKIKVGASVLELDEHIRKFYIKRTFRRTKHKEDENPISAKRGDIVHEEEICEINEKAILISDKAGTGKSTVLSNLAVNIKKKYPHMWVILIDLKDYTQILNDYVRRNKKTINILELLDSKHSTKLTSQFERTVFLLNKRVVLMLDGFNEISPDYTELILSLLSLCREQQNFAKVIVTTRPHMSQKLEEKLQVEPFFLEPFTKQNQIDFLAGYWMQNLDMDSTGSGKCEEYAKALVEEMSSWVRLFEEGANDFAAIPLHVRMLAEIFQESSQLEMSDDWKGCKEYLLGDEIEPKLPANVNITRLYKLFIEKKRSIFVDKGNLTGNRIANQVLNDVFEECITYHKSLALELILGKTKRELFSCLQQTSGNVEINVLKIGIVQKIDNEFRFAHRTFAEYFVAECLIEELERPNENVEFQKFLIEDMLLKSQFDVIHVFFNSSLQQMIDVLFPNTFYEYKCVSYKMTSFDAEKIELLNDIVKNGHLAIFQLVLKCVDLNIFKKTSKSSGQIFKTIEESIAEYNNILNMLQQKTPDIKPIRKTFLEFTAVRGNLEVVKVFVEQGANIKDIITILYQTILGNHFATVKYLLEKTLRSGGLNSDDFNISYTAAYLGRLDILTKLIERGLDIKRRGENGETVIFGAVRGGQIETIEYLLEEGCDINSTDYKRNTALHIIAQDLRLVSTAKLLMEKGIDVNAANDDLTTALHIAVEGDRVDLVKLLLKHNADVNVANQEGETSLHIAVKKDNFNLVKLLVNGKTNVNLAKQNGTTALHTAVEKKYFGLVEFLVNCGADVNLANQEGETSLHVAMKQGDFELVEFLVNHDANVNLMNQKGETSLHIAVKEDNFELVGFLVNRGADVNLANQEAETSLHIAMKKDNFELVKFLVNHGADVNLANQEGETSLHIAMKQDNFELVEFLVNYGVDVNLKDLIGDEVEPKLPENMCVSKFYKLLIDKKQSVFIDKGNPSGNPITNRALMEQFEECLSYHKTLALEFILNKTQRELFVCYRQTHKNIEINLLKLGIVEKVNNEFNFVHKSFAEYFVAESLLEELQLPNKNIEFQKFLFEEIFLKPQFVIHAFFNSFLQQVIDTSPNTFYKYMYVWYKITSFDAKKLNLLNNIVRNGHLAVFQLILKCVDVKFFIKTAESPIQYFKTPVLESKPTYTNILNIIQQRVLDVQYGDVKVTFLELAAVGGHLEMVRFLVEQGADVNVGEFQPLHLAVAGGHFEIVKFLVEQGADVRAKDSIYCTTTLYKAISRNDTATANYLLNRMWNDNLDATDSIIPYAAAYLGRLDVLEELLKQGLDVNSTVENDETVIFGAVRGGQLETIIYLLKLGCDINCRDHKNNTALHVASRDPSLTSIAESLVELGIDVNAKNFEFLTALHIAVEENNLDLVKILVNCGADVTTLEDVKGNTALHLAAKFGSVNKQSVKNLDLIRFLIKNGGDINIRDLDGSTVLHVAAREGHLDMVTLLVESKVDVNSTDSYGRTALHLAVMEDHTHIIEFLIKENADCNIRDINDRTVLHYLASSKHILGKHFDSKNDRTDLLRLVLQNVKDVDLKGKDGRTVLHFAISRGDLDTVIHLVESGIDVDIRDADGRTGLHLAVINECHFDIVKYLLENGADRSARDNFGYTVLHLVVKNTYQDENYLNIVKVITTECTEAVNIKDETGCTPLHLAAEKGAYDIVDLLVSSDVEVNATDDTGSTALHKAVSKGNYDIAKYLVEAGADVRIRDNCGYTALHLAARGRVVDIFSTLRDSTSTTDDSSDCSTTEKSIDWSDTEGTTSDTDNTDHDLDANLLENFCSGSSDEFRKVRFNLGIIKILIAKCNDVINVRDESGRTALHLAVLEGNLEVIGVLVRFNANINVKDNSGRSALQLAVDIGRLDIAKSLVEYGADTKGYDWVISDSNHRTALHLAAERGQLDNVAFFAELVDVNVTDDKGNMALHLALNRGHLSVVKCLVEKGTAVTGIEDYDRIVLHLAAKSGNLSMMTFFVKHCADIDVTDKNGNTILHSAVHKDGLAIVKFVVDIGIDVNIKNDDGRTALHLASERGCLEIAEFLVELGQA